MTSSPEIASSEGRAWRERNDLTLEAAVELSGVQPRTVRRWECGDHKPGRAARVLLEELGVAGPGTRLADQRSACARSSTSVRAFTKIRGRACATPETRPSFKKRSMTVNASPGGLPQGSARPRLTTSSPSMRPKPRNLIPGGSRSQFRRGEACASPGPIPRSPGVARSGREPCQDIREAILRCPCAPDVDGGRRS